MRTGQRGRQPCGRPGNPRRAAGGTRVERDSAVGKGARGVAVAFTCASLKYRITAPIEGLPAHASAKLRASCIGSSGTAARLTTPIGSARARQKA